MAVRERKCMEMNTSWINSSFMDSFGTRSTKGEEDDVDSNDEYEVLNKKKRLKLSTDETSKENDNEDVSFVNSKVRPNKDQRLWPDKYVPKNVDDLVINKKKISEVEGWLKDAFRSSNNNLFGKVLLLTGPTGSGKTCTLNVLCKSLGIGIVEWITPLDISQEYGEFNIGFVRRKTVIQMFEEFLLRATKYSSLLSGEPSKRVILIKDIPSNFLDDPGVFHEIIKTHTVPDNISPIIFIVSCSDICRDLFPDSIKYQLKITNINFNPVTEMSMLKALNRAIQYESKLNRKVAIPPKPDLVDICQSSDGDLRSALLKLQFGIDGGGDASLFKIPTMDSNLRRTRIKKTTTKKGGVKQTVSEIDKDKKLDFFHSVGRVLYPKKETQNEKDLKRYTFVHSPDMIVETFLTEPNKLVNILHENYLDRFVNIKDVTVASEKLAITDLLFAPWEGKDILIEYGLSVTVRGLMTSNTHPAETRWKPLSKSRIYTTEMSRKENLNNARIIIPDPQSSKDALLDTIPYLTKLNVSLPPDKGAIIKNLTTYLP